VPLCLGSCSGAVDVRKIKLISNECSDLLLRGCTRESPALCAGLLLLGGLDEPRR
jgi:hypothetical protein